MSILALDGDSLVYKACGIAEKTVYDILPLDKEELAEDYEDYKPYIIETFRYVADYQKWLKENGKKKEDFLRKPRIELQPLAYALQIVGSMLGEIINAVGMEQVVIFIGGDNNFREAEAVMKGYKETRKKKPKPQYYKQCREYMVRSWNAIMVDGEEADDAVAQLYTSCMLDDQFCVIATIDKDLNTVQGWKYNYDTKAFHYTTVWEASYTFYKQLLMGDRNDDIAGVPGIGVKTAEKILASLNSEEEMYRAALEQYQKAFKVEETTHNKKFVDKVGEKILRENANLLHMRRYKGEIWVPPVQA